MEKQLVKKFYNLNNYYEIIRPPAFGNLVFDFSLNFHFTLGEKPRNKSLEYLKIYTSPITLEKADILNRKTRRIIGALEVWLVNGSLALDRNLDIAELCGGNEELSDYVYPFYRDGRLNERYADLPRSNDLMILHKIEIIREFQGHKISLLVFQRIMESLGYTCGAVVLRPRPLQFEEFAWGRKWSSLYGSRRFNPDKEKCRVKLYDYWKNLSEKTKRTPRRDMIFIAQD